MVQGTLLWQGCKTTRRRLRRARTDPRRAAGLPGPSGGGSPGISVLSGGTKGPFWRIIRSDTLFLKKTTARGSPSLSGHADGVPSAPCGREVTNLSLWGAGGTHSPAARRRLPPRHCDSHRRRPPPPATGPQPAGLGPVPPRPRARAGPRPGGAVRRSCRQVAPLIAEWREGARARETQRVCVCVCHPPPPLPPFNLGSVITKVFSTDYYAWVTTPWVCNIFARISLFYNII